MPIGLIGVRGLGKGDVLARLGERESDRPARLWSEPCVGVSKDGWVFVVKPDPDFPARDRLAAVSADAEAVGYWDFSTVMATEALGYRDGRQIWSIEHDGEDGEDDLRADGQLPPAFEAIASAARELQAKEEEPVDHMYGVTEDVLFSVCGFHPEREFDIEFTALERQGPKRKPSLLARLLGLG